MALFEAFQTPRNVDPASGELTVANASLIQVVSGTVTFNYWGSYQYDANGALTGGVNTGFEMIDSANGGLQARITGLNVDAIAFITALAYGNEDALTQLWFAGNDTLVGSNGDDVLQGYAGADSISGGWGNDILDGTDDTVADTLAGGPGDDVYGVGGFEHPSNDIVIEGASAGHDLVIALTSYALPANVEDLQLGGNGNSSGTGNELDNLLTGNTGSNLLLGLAGNDTLDGGAGGIDTLRGGDGDDTYLVSSGVTVIEESAGGGNDTVRSSVSFTLAAQLENLVLTGSSPLEGHGNALANLITGNDAGNTLDGGAGADTLHGGLGNDLYVVDNLGDVIVDAGGVDTVRASVDGYALGTPGIENLELAGSAISGSGDAGANRLVGNALQNLLYGLGGNDTLDGGAGADTLVGGDGDDSYIVDHVGDTIVEVAGGGVDQVFSSVSYALPGQVEQLSLTVAGLTGTGNALANLLTGTVGSDTLDGGAGADTLQGGLGADTYLVDNAGDVVVETGSDTDTIVATVSYDLAHAAGVENLTLAGSANLSATGNAEVNVLTGNAGNNVLTAVASVYNEGDSLFGAGGNDSLVGSSGDDLLDGGTGADTMAGGTGRDVYVVDSSADVVVEGSSPISGGEGDVIQAWASYTMPQYVEFMTLMGHAALNGTGSAAGGETITGNDADNVLDSGGGNNDELWGLAGNDTLSDGGGYARMYGGTGDDTYIVSSSLYWVVEQAGEGTDTVRAMDSFELGANLENLVLVGGLSATGNALDNVITGNAGMNFIDGKGGADTMIGGAGDDQYYVDDPGDVVIELDGQGYDSIVTYGVSISLVGTSVERVYGEQSGFADLDITGNALDNFLRGSNGNNIIDGGAGADTMTGYLGDDVFVVDNAGDAIWEFEGQGTDWAWSKRDAYTLEANVENLRLLDGAAAATGNGAANLMQGNAGNNLLDGAGGNDTLWGGQGDDTLTGGAGDDTLDGDVGVDVALYAGLRASYVVTRDGGTVIVTGAEGADRLTGIESIAFADQVMLLDEHLATGTVSIEGTAREGRVLAASAAGVADADGVGSFTYQWFRGWDAIAGATAASYQAQGADVGATLSVRLRFVDGAGNTESLWSGVTAAIAPGDHTPPTVTSFFPSDDATGVAREANIVVTFSEAVQRGSGSIVLKSGDGAVVESFDAATSSHLAIAGNTLTIDPSDDLSWLTDYTLEFAPSSVRDLEGNGYAGTTTYNFRTLPEPDFTPPTVQGFVPTQPDGTNVGAASSFMILFSEAVQRGTGVLELRTAGGTLVESFDVGSSARLTFEGSTLLVDPTADLVPGTSYQLGLGAATIQDRAGNPLSASTSFRFATTPHAVDGTAGADRLQGTWMGDLVHGAGGDDTITGGAGSDTIDGGDGRDVAVYSAPSTAYLIAHTAGGFVVTARADADDADTLVNVERLQFTDLNVALDLDGTAGQAYRLYKAAFDRTPDIPGLGYHIRALDAGWGIGDVAQTFIISPEFQRTYGAVNDEGFVRLLYENVLDREPEAEGLQYHLDRLAHGVPRAAILVGFSESPENKANVIGVIQDGMAYIPLY